MCIYIYICVCVCVCVIGRGSGTEAWSERTGDRTARHLVVDSGVVAILYLGLFENGEAPNFYWVIMISILIHIDSSKFPPEHLSNVGGIRLHFANPYSGTVYESIWEFWKKKQPVQWKDVEFEDHATGLRKNVCNRTFKNWWSFTRTAASMASLLMLMPLDWIGGDAAWNFCRCQRLKRDSFNKHHRLSPLIPVACNMNHPELSTIWDYLGPLENHSVCWV